MDEQKKEQLARRLQKLEKIRDLHVANPNDDKIGSMAARELVGDNQVDMEDPLTQMLLKTELSRYGEGDAAALSRIDSLMQGGYGGFREAAGLGGGGVGSNRSFDSSFDSAGSDEKEQLLVDEYSRRLQANPKSAAEFKRRYSEYDFNEGDVDPETGGMSIEVKKRNKAPKFLGIF